MTVAGSIARLYSRVLLSGTIEANSITTLYARQNMENAHITFNQPPAPRTYAARTIVVGRWLTDSTLIVAGNIRSVRIGASRDSVLFTGVDVTQDQDGAGGVPDGVLDLPDPATDLALDPAARARIDSLRVVGIRGEPDCVINSNVAAAEFGYIYTFNSRDENDGVRFGIAADYIRDRTGGGHLSNRELDVQALRKGASAAIADERAEQLYTKAVALYKNQDLFALKSIIESPRAECPHSHPVTDPNRSPSFVDMAEATANLGKLITIRQDGTADFRSVQDAIGARAAQERGRNPGQPHIQRIHHDPEGKTGADPPRQGWPLAIIAPPGG